MVSPLRLRLADRTTATLSFQLLLIVVAALLLAHVYGVLVGIYVPVMWILGAKYVIGSTRQVMRAGDVPRTVRWVCGLMDEEERVAYADTVYEYFVRDVDESVVEEQSSVARRFATSRRSGEQATTG